MLRRQTFRQQPDSQCTGDRWTRSEIAGALWWLAAFVIVVGFLVYRLDLFPLATTVVVDGKTLEVPRTFLTIDHPFHIARTQLIADHWADFQSVRWVANHQGGYPAEFFPFGVSGIIAFVHFLSLGTLSVVSSYTLVVVGLYLVPALAFWLIARIDRVSSGVALVAFTGHVAIASTWLQGGYTELFGWGLVTNAAGSLFGMLALPLLTGAVQRGNVRWAALAVVIIAASVYGNPRSLVALCTIALAILVHALLFSRRAARELRWLMAVGGVSMLVCAPLLIPLIRYRDLYYFLHFEEYGSARAFLGSSGDTVSWPIAILTLVGCLATFRNAAHRVSQVVSLTFLFYAGLTLLATEAAWVRDLVPQLELPRLMPFQRLLMLYLAGYALMELARMASGKRFRFPVPHFLAGIGTIAIVVIFATGIGPRHGDERGLRPIPRVEGSAAGELAELHLAIDRADEVVPKSSAVLVLESTLSWHEQLWAPLWSDRRFYYDDWLWYWHTLHDGPYDYRVGHAYPDPTDALTDHYFATHGIGAVVVTAGPSATGGNARVAAAQSPLLQPEGTFGNWDVLTVVNPVPLATLGGTNPAEIDVSPDGTRISLSFEDAPAGTIIIRENWFPRWTATINGDEADVSRAANGYMAIETSGGNIEVVVTYATTILDQVGRALAIIGAAIVGAGLIAGNRFGHVSALSGSILQDRSGE